MLESELHIQLKFLIMYINIMKYNRRQHIADVDVHTIPPYRVVGTNSRNLVISRASLISCQQMLWNTMKVQIRSVKV